MALNDLCSKGGKDRLVYIADGLSIYHLQIISEILEIENPQEYWMLTSLLS